MQQLAVVCLVASFAYGITAVDVDRRFLFQSGNGGFPCNPSQSRCSLTCSNGYVTGPAGCFYCTCATTSQQSQHSGPMGVYPNTGGSHFAQNPAGNPQMQQQFAHAQCLRSASECKCKAVEFHIGLPCYYCDCNSNTTTASPQVVTTSKIAPQTMSSLSTSTAALRVTSPSVIVLTTKVSPSMNVSNDYCKIAAQLCDKTCPGGYLVDSEDCTYCVCKADVMKG